MDFTGLREQTPFRMVFDAGAFIVGINEVALRTTGVAAAISTPWMYGDVEVTPRALGATRAGAMFDPQKEERQIEVNNARVPLMGMSRVDSYTPILSVTLLEMADPETFVISLGQGTRTTTDSGFIEVVPRVEVLASDYIPNVALMARTSENGQEKPVIVVIRNAKVVENSSFTFEDPGELAPEVSFQGHSNVLAASTVPCSIYIPENIDGLGSGS